MPNEQSGVKNQSLLHRNKQRIWKTLEATTAIITLITANSEPQNSNKQNNHFQRMPKNKGSENLLQSPATIIRLIHPKVTL